MCECVRLPQKRTTRNTAGVSSVAFLALCGIVGRAASAKSSDSVSRNCRHFAPISNQRNRSHHNALTKVVFAKERVFCICTLLREGSPAGRVAPCVHASKRDTAHCCALPLRRDLPRDTMHQRLCDTHKGVCKPPLYLESPLPAQLHPFAAAFARPVPIPVTPLPVFSSHTNIYRQYEDCHICTKSFCAVKCSPTLCSRACRGRRH
jgi:hypothetical protein